MVVAGRKHTEISGIAEISEKLGTLFDFPLQFYPSFWTEIGIGRSASSEHPTNVNSDFRRREPKRAPHPIREIWGN